MTTKMAQMATNYILKAGGGGSMSIEHFDDDWDPVGPALRAELLREGVTLEEDGQILVRDKTA